MLAKVGMPTEVIFKNPPQLCSDLARDVSPLPVVHPHAVFKLEHAAVPVRPVLVRLELPPLLEVGDHDDDGDVLLQHEAPEGGDHAGCRGLFSSFFSSLIHSLVNKICLDQSWALAVFYFGGRHPVVKDCPPKKTPKVPSSGFDIIHIIKIIFVTVHTVQFGEFCDRNSNMTFLYFNKLK